MKQIKDIKKKIEWEDYYNPDFNWDNLKFYIYNQLSENFIREFKDRVNWTYIFKYQDLSEDFIREFQDKVDWTYIFKCQDVSEEFKNELYTFYEAAARY